MSGQNQPLDSLKDIHDIRQIMERSARFISLSGLSGISAGICGLVASWMAYDWINEYYFRYNIVNRQYVGTDFEALKWKLMVLAVVVLSVALVAAYYFTWRRARQSGIKMWNISSRRLIWNMLIPLISGGVFILSMVQQNVWTYIAPACLIFYGLALVNGSKYTLSDIRYLGYFEIVLGLICTQFTGYGLYFWAVGFGILHVIYGGIMWWKYERK